MIKIRTCLLAAVAQSRELDLVFLSGNCEILLQSFFCSLHLHHEQQSGSLYSYRAGDKVEGTDVRRYT